MECLYLYLKVDGMLVSVCSSNDGVWGVSANGELWFRAGLDQVLFFQKKLTNLLLNHRQIVQYLFKVPSVFCVASVHSVFFRFIHKFRSSITFFSGAGRVSTFFKSFRSILFRSFSKNDVQPLSWACSYFFNRFILFRSFSKNDVQPLSWACSYFFKSFHFDPFVLQEQCLVLDRGVFLLFFISFSSVRSRERTIVPQELFSLWWLSCLPSFDFFFLCLLFIPIIQFFHLVF